jgi:deoxyribodipyrimidine photolyase
MIKRGRFDINFAKHEIFFVSNPEKVAAWKEGRTGFPYIDAIMTQLKE